MGGLKTRGPCVFVFAMTAPSLPLNLSLKHGDVLWPQGLALNSAKRAPAIVNAGELPRKASTRGRVSKSGSPVYRGPLHTTLHVTCNVSWRTVRHTCRHEVTLLNPGSDGSKLSRTQSSGGTWGGVARHHGHRVAWRHTMVIKAGRSRPAFLLF